jgi:hypothetical protein
MKKEMSHITTNTNEIQRMIREYFEITSNGIEAVIQSPKKEEPRT